jgi:hypothetical protein
MNQAADEIRSEDKSVAMNALIAEFNAIRAEIIFRATSQSTLMQINITAAGTIAVFALANDRYILAMIIIPILSPVLGILWLDHDATIMKLGGFIEKKLKPAYGRIVKDFDFPDYQNYTHFVDVLPIPKLAILNFNIAVLVTFGLLPFAALIYVAFSLNNMQSYPVFVSASFAIIILLMFITQFTRKFRRPSESNATTGEISD